MKKQFIVYLASVLFLSGNICYAIEYIPDHEIIDSSMTLKEALNGVNSACPQEILNNQRLVNVTYYSSDGLIHQGQIIVDRRLVDDVKQVFDVALKEKFPFARVIPISQYGWSDEESMDQNNTSGFNYRMITGGQKLSNHSLGFAIDINPLLNPYIKGEMIQPSNAVYDPKVPGTLFADHIIVKTFVDLGWAWGGNWQSLKDYQHFEKVIEK